MAKIIQSILFLKTGELSRLLPFFALYGLLFGCMTIADGVSLALFIQRVGHASLPLYYGLTAISSLALIWFYLKAARKWSNEALFQFIIWVTATQFMITYIALHFGLLGGQQGSLWYGVLFVAREVSYTLILMHFGTYLQNFFSRDELNRVLPLVYAGGRLGGIGGASCLSQLSLQIKLIELMPLVIGFLVLCSFFVLIFGRRIPQYEEDEQEAPCSQTMAPCSGLRELGRFVASSPLMLWFSLSGVLFMMCRWLLNYQYNHFFELHFKSEVELAAFIGNYSQMAMSFSLVFQLLCVSRLIERIGLKGSHLLYNLMMLAGFYWNALGLTVASALYSRFVETELRFGLRNPVNQLITNKFTKATRIKARAITLGAVNPIATMATSCCLFFINQTTWLSVGTLALILGFVYVGLSFFLYRSFSESLPQLKLSSFFVPALRRHKPR